MGVVEADEERNKLRELVAEERRRRGVRGNRQREERGSEQREVVGEPFYTDCWRPSKSHSSGGQNLIGFDSYSYKDTPTGTDEAASVVQGLCTAEYPCACSLCIGAVTYRTTEAPSSRITRAVKFTSRASELYLPRPAA